MDLQQAVILAGGMGTRLHPITQDIPKPMVSIASKPFLEHLILQLKSYGIKRILLLLGYLPGPIIEYFGEGSKWGVSIEYSITAIENDTANRLRLAKDRLDDSFLLLYCDNYCPFDLDAAYRQFIAKDTMAQITVYANTDAYSKDNVVVDAKKDVLLYDKKREAKGLKGVDIGYIFMKKKLIERLPSENVNFEAFLYPKLVANKELSAYVTHHRYYSIGSIERLSKTEAFFSAKPAILLDRDGVINERPPKGRYVLSPEEFVWRKGSREALSLLKSLGFRLALISNQAGVGRGFMSQEAVEIIHAKMQQDLQEARFDYIYYCPHDFHAECFCRKPQPGMLFQAQRDMDLNLKKTFFIGDDERDIIAGEAAGALTYHFKSQENLLEVVEKIILPHYQL